MERSQTVHPRSRPSPPAVIHREASLAGDRSARRSIAILIAAALAALIGLLRLPPTTTLLETVQMFGIGICPWRALTHVPCPGCGGTRALLSLSRLDIPGAFALNPLVAGGVLGGILLGAAALVAPGLTDLLLTRSGSFLTTRGGRLTLVALLVALMVAETIIPSR